MYCKYKDIFGKVGSGIHSYRIANIAIVDVLLHRPTFKMR